MKALRAIARRVPAGGLISTLGTDGLVGWARKRHGEAAAGVIVYVAPLGGHDVVSVAQGVGETLIVEEIERGL